MSQQHTPGPWMQSPGDPAVINGHREDSPLDDFVAMVLPDSDLGWGMTAERAANARLIAAAPDLLAALRNMVEEASINDCAENGPTCAGCSVAVASWPSRQKAHDAGCYVEAARAAIAKAEGREG